MIYIVELRDKTTNELVHADELETKTKLDDEKIIDFVHRVITDFDVSPNESDDYVNYNVTLRVDDDDII